MCEINRKTDREQYFLIFLCWLVYTTAYIGRYSYSANISQIEEAFGVSHTQSGLVTTFFFIVYGAGQIINGFFCRRYPKRPVLCGAVLVSAAINLAIWLGVGFSAYKYLWLVNGAAQSVLYSSLMMIIGENVEQKNFKKAVLAMGSTVGVGTLAAYGLSALFTLLHAYKLIFLIAFVIMTATAAAWFFGYGALYRRLAETRKRIASEKRADESAEPSGNAKKGRIGKGVIAVISVCALYAVFNNLIKDGMLTWAPSVMIEKFALSSGLSVLLTVLLPVLGMLGSVLIVWIDKRLHKNYFLTAGVLFLGVAVLCSAVILLLGSSSLWIAAILCIAAVNCLMVALNNLLTTVIPLDLRDKAPTGFLAGLLDGFCYAGSAVSSFGIGAIADGVGWTAVFWLFVGISLFAAAIAACALLVKRVLRNRAEKAQAEDMQTDGE